MSQVGVLTIFYCIYVSLFEFLDTLLFIWSFPLGINIKFYILIAVLELGSFMFVRTRTSLKYFPKFIFLFLFMFCFYIQFNSYAFYDEAFVCIVLATISLLLLFIIFIEIPALSWNPSFHYTPSVEKPRTLYNPLFSMSWYYDLPHLWTMFFPLHDRSTFTENEMALIDRKYLVLSQLLNPQQEASEDIFHDNHQLQGVIQFDINTINYNNRYEEIIHRSENENMNNLLPNNQYRNSE